MTVYVILWKWYESGVETTQIHSIYSKKEEAEAVCNLQNRNTSVEKDGHGPWSGQEYVIESWMVL